MLLSILNARWREHLYEMDQLREGIGLRAYGQRDPLTEYQREGFDMFGAMMDSLKEEFIRYMFHVQVVEEPKPQPQPVPATRAVRPGSGHGDAERPRRGRTGRNLGGHSRGARPHREGAAKCPLPLRVGQEVQALPRPGHLMTVDGRVRGSGPAP